MAGGTTNVTAATGVSQTGDEGGTQATEQQPQQPQPAEAEPAPEPQQAKEEHMYQCGLEDNAGEWHVQQRYPPIKESRLKPEEKAKYLDHLEKIFQYDTLTGIRYRFHPDDVMEVLTKVREYLKEEPMLIEDVPFGVTIVGDLHGHLHDLDRVFKGDARDGRPGWLNMKYLFLGDYVDRGRQSLEILMALFCLKMLYPDRIFLLRGNHEFITTNYRYGFPVELNDRYIYETAKKLFFQFNETFCFLSVAAIVGDQYFCAHGGVSPSGCTRRSLLAIPKPIGHSHEDVLMHDIVWSDPARGLRGSVFNGDRGSSVYYGLDVLALALFKLNCIGLFRAHSMLEGGYEVIGFCISLFTCTGMSGGSNHGACARIDENGKLKLRILECDHDRVSWERTLKRVDAGLEEAVDEPEEKTVFEDGGEGVGGKLKTA